MHKHPLPSPQTWHLLVFSRSGAQLAIDVLASSLSLLIDKTVKPACWNSLRRQVWRDRGLESNRWEPQQSNNLLSRAVLIKISPTTSPSPLWFKFICSPLPQPPSGRSQRPCPPARSPRGTHSPSSLHSVKIPALGRQTSLLRGSSKPRTCSAANARQEEAAETTGCGYSLTLDKLRKKDRNHRPRGCSEARPHSEENQALSSSKQREGPRKVASRANFYELLELAPPGL